MVATISNDSTFQNEVQNMHVFDRIHSCLTYRNLVNACTDNVRRERLESKSAKSDSTIVISGKIGLLICRKFGSFLVLRFLYIVYFISELTGIRFPLVPWAAVREALNQKGRDRCSKFLNLDTAHDYIQGQNKGQYTPDASVRGGSGREKIEHHAIHTHRRRGKSRC